MMAITPGNYSLRLHREFPGKGPLLELHVADEYDDDAMALVPLVKSLARSAMSDPEIGRRHDCRFSLHDQSDTWLMYEFWTQDLEYVRDAANRLIAALSRSGVELRLMDALSHP